MFVFPSTAHADCHILFVDDTCVYTVTCQCSSFTYCIQLLQLREIVFIKSVKQGQGQKEAPPSWNTGSMKHCLFLWLQEPPVLHETEHTLF